VILFHWLYHILRIVLNCRVSDSLLEFSALLYFITRALVIIPFLLSVLVSSRLVSLYLYLFKFIDGLFI